MKKKKDSTPLLFPEEELERLFEEQVGKIEEEVLEANFDVDALIRRVMSEAIRRSGLSRFAVAARMSELLHKDITKYQIDTWTAESKEGYKIPAAYIPAFCEAVGDIRLLRILAAPLGVKVVESKDMLWLEYARVRELRRQLQRRERALKEKLISQKRERK